MTHDEGALWWVRYGGRVSGPFDLERLRIMAARGALTRLHQVSTDQSSWTSAGTLPGMLAGSGAGSGTGVGAGEHGEGLTAVAGARGGIGADAKCDALAFDEGTAHTDEAMHPTRSGLAAPASSPATIRAAQGVAIIMAALALAAPTSRWPDGSLQWWPQQQPLSIAVHTLCAATIAAWWVAMALVPAPAVGSALAATSALLAAAVALPLLAWAPWAMPFALLVPCAAMLVAAFGASAAHRRAMGTCTAIAAPLCTVVAGLLLWRSFSAWGAAAAVLGGAGAMVLAWAAAQVARQAPVAPFAAIATASVALVGALFATACGGLASGTPIHGAAGAVAALLTLSLSVLAWAGMHQLVAQARAPSHPSRPLNSAHSTLNRS